MRDRTRHAGRVSVAIAALPAALLLLTATFPSAPAAAETVPFDSNLWSGPGPRVVEHDGRTCMTGLAWVEGADITGGVLEVDLYATGATSYPGFVFHLAGQGDYEHVYVRPHRANQYPDAAQYAPSVNGISSWQLYNGDGYTAPLPLPEAEWVHLRLEFSASQARLYVGDAAEPALHVRELARGPSGGSVGLSCPSDGSAFFSDFSYRADDTLVFDPVPPAETPPGTIIDWSISQAFPMSLVDLERPPSEQDVGGVTWTDVTADASGLVNVGSYVGRTGGLPDCVFATTSLTAERADTLRLEFGYSDAVSVFLNGRLLFTASNAYRQRDPTALGIIGLFDALYLPLEPGENELALIVTESFGGWGFVARDGNARFTAPGVEMTFETEGFVTPESIVYDAERGDVYVANFDAYRRLAASGGQYVTRMSLNGEILDERWVGGLSRPTGMALDGSTLYVVERTALAEVDVTTREVVARHEIPGAAFPNDVTVDASGRAYVSDSAGNRIYRLEAGEFIVWLEGEEVAGPNSVEVDGGALLFGTGGDHCVKSADLETGDVRTIARFREGNIDGLEVVGDGLYLVSQWEGRLYRLHADGTHERLLDTTVSGGNIADIEYVPGERLLLIPAFFGDAVTGYTVP